jgi:acetylglutamate kinase
MKRPVVVKAGGELMASVQVRAKILRDLARWRKSHPVVFVHGGGPQIEAELVKNKVAVDFVDGRRVTSDEAMVIVERVLSGQVNKSIVAELTAKKIKAAGLSGRDGGTVTGVPLPQLGRAGKPSAIDTKLILSLLKEGFLPVLSSVASDKKGQALNINADDFASALACALKAQNLIFLTDISGVRNKNKKRIPVLKIGQIDELIEDKTIQGGMIPKVQSARQAISKGVGEVDIVNGSLGIELSQGTRIIK